MVSLLFRSSLLALVALAPTVSFANARTPYDGRWSLSINTTRGSCDTYNFPVDIMNGHVSFPGLVKANGRVDAAFGQIGRGVFHVDENSKRLDYLSSLSPMDVNESRLRQLPGFVGEETILGVQCFHFHSTSDESGESFDSWIPPALQGFPLRTVSVAKSGAKNIHEVTEVIWGEPAFTTPDYAVDMTRYDEIHGPVSATRAK